MGLFLFLEVLPLFGGARIHERSTPLPWREPNARLVVVDEHRERALVVGKEPFATVVPLHEAAAQERIALKGLEGQQISAASRTLHQAHAALGTAQGDVWVGSLGLQAVFEGSRRVVRPSIGTDTVMAVAPGHRIDRLAYRETETAAVIAALLDDQSLRVIRVTMQRPLAGPVRRQPQELSVSVKESGQLTALLIDPACKQLIAGTSDGRIVRWMMPTAGALQVIEIVSVIPTGGVSAIAYVLGDRSIVVGGSDGSIGVWSFVRNAASPDGQQLKRFHRFPPHAAAVTTIQSSPRDKGFLTVSNQGIARLHYMTSERTLGEFRVGPTVAADFAPKANGVLFVDQAGALSDWEIRNPHPEFSWNALFGKIWYEGYQQPDYVWQSSGGTDDFEPKFSVVPLLFGTFKGTCYALLFSVPLALFGALYCSQFLDKRLRNWLKSSIELMAALPSVVLGFVAGIVLAPLVQRHIVSALTAPVIVPMVAVGGMFLCSALSMSAVAKRVNRHEFWVLAAWVLVGIGVAFWIEPWIEGIAFGGDFERWLLQAAGIQYDQRNALVVGWAMGFAVIPIIFTICEDACSSVPRHLIGASLACGASRWQTAWRVVLPAAGSGVFSGIIVGFGRAVGETMIVLMATGNTPVLQWSLFNGFRTLSANLAVEISEAPAGGTLYRVLFLSALLLFAMTSLVNTAAELVRLRLRRRLQGL